MPDPRLPLAQLITTRDGTLSKDSLMQNMIQETQPGKIESVKRPGTPLVQGGIPAGTPQGMFTLQGQYYTIVNNVVYNVISRLAYIIPSDPPPGLIFDFIEDVVFGSGIITVMKTETYLYTFDGTTVTVHISMTYPVPTVRGIVLLDGTYYVMQPDGTIYGSAIQDPTTWTALNFIGTDPGLGAAVRLFHHLNYALAMSTSGCQAFYDNANPPPGSPLSPASNAVFRIGCASAASVVSLGDMTIFVSKSALTRGRSVSAFSGLSIVTLSSPYVDKILNRSSLLSVYAFGVSTTGHSFYVLNLLDIGVTLVCDLLEKAWYIWTSNVNGVQQPFQFGFYLNGVVQDLLQHLTDGSVHALEPSSYTDNGTAIACRIVTNPFDGGTVTDKFFSALNLIGDTVQTTVSVRYSDDDYESWSAFRPVDMGSKRKQQRGLGKSRRRQFELLHEDATPLRLEAIEFDVNLGNT